MRKRVVSISYIFRLLLLPAILIVSGMNHTVTAQELPPRPIVVTPDPSWPLSFGAFTPGASGGTISVVPDGTARTATGTVLPLNLGQSFSPAMFRIKANPGTVVSILTGSPSTLNGSNGGTLSLQLDGTWPSSPLVTQLPYPQETTVLVGGTLTVGNIGTNPAGSYSGVVNVTFVQE